MSNLTMTTFQNINSKKLPFIFKVIFICFFILLTALYFLPFNDKPKLIFLIFYHVLFSVISSFLVVTLIYINGYFYYSSQEKLFGSISLLNFLKKYEFKTDLINADNKWQLTQRIKTGHIDNYPVIIFKAHDKLNSLNVVFELDFLLTNRADFLKAQSLFAPYKITIGEGAILKQIHNPKNIEEQIVELSKLLKENNFRSANKEGVA